MKISKSNAFSTLALAALAALSGVLAGCGGDGGSDDGSTTATLELSAANSDAVAHATGAGFMAFGSTILMPLNASDRATALASNGSGSWLPPRVLDSLLLAMRGTARTGVARPLAVIAMPPEPCSVSGTTTMSVDDANGNNTLDIGETFTLVFDACQDSAASVTHGSVSGAVTSTSDSGLSARMTLSSLAQSAVDGSHSLTLDGNVLLGYRMLSDTMERMRLSADGALTALAHSHVFDDTLTLLSGFEQSTTHDYITSLSTSTVAGMMESTVAGGSFAVSTLTPIEIHDADTYPRAGVVEMRGRTGIMALRSLPAAQVQIDLDANGDGTLESSTTQTWDWLF